MIVRTFLNRLRKDKSAATTVEYAMILAVIVLAIIGAIRGVADKNTGLWASVERRAAEAHNQSHP